PFGWDGPGLDPWGGGAIHFANGQGAFSIKLWRNSDQIPPYVNCGLASPGVRQGACILGVHAGTKGYVDRDLRSDMAMSVSASLFALAISNGDGTFQTSNLTTTGLSILQIAARAAHAKVLTGDFDGDGLADLAVTGSNSSVYVGASRGDGSFTVRSWSDS